MIILSLNWANEWIIGFPLESVPTLLLTILDDVILSGIEKR